MSSSPLPPWSDFRAQMPVVRQWAYFDHAAVAPISGPAQVALGAYAQEFAEHGAAHWSAWAARLEDTRAAAARLLNAQAEEIALVPNTTWGLTLVAEGFPWRSGDNVVLPADEFPSNQYPWLNLAARGVEARRVSPVAGRVTADQLLAACDGRTRLVACSWVGFAHGARLDLDRLAAGVHQRGALLCVDGIQGLGVLPLDVQRIPIDFLSADGHKWLLGPEGAGLLYIRREHLDLLRPLCLGWNSVVHHHDFDRIALDLRPTAARYEGGSANLPGHLALGASLELLLRWGPAALAERIRELAGLAAQRLQALGAELHSPRAPELATGIVSFTLPGRAPQTVRRECLRAGVLLSCRSGRLRISPHAYNDQADVERLLAALVATG